MSGLDESVLDQIAQERFRSVRSYPVALELLQPDGEAFHVFSVGTAEVEARPLMQFPDKLLWSGGDYGVTALDSVGSFHAVSFLVLILKYSFSLSVRKGMPESVVRWCTSPCCAKVIIFSRK